MPLAVSIPELLGYDAIKLGDMVMAGTRQFTIPMNQRPWEWSPTQLDQLWTDLRDAAHRFFEPAPPDNRWNERTVPTGHPHFFGAFVFDEEAGAFTVVDGQQRLTAVSMLVAALRERATSLLPTFTPGSTATECQSLIHGLTLWLESGIPTGTYVPRLVLDSSYADFFEHYIVQPLHAEDRQQRLVQMQQQSLVDFATMPIHRRLRTGFDYLHRRVLSAFRDLTTEAELTVLRALNLTLSEAFVCLTLRVRDEAFSYSVFGCLNARGTPLTGADKIKNELFDQTPLSAHPAVKLSWDETVELCPKRDMPTFLRLRHVAFVGECPKNQLYFNVLTRELRPPGASVLDILGQWKEDAHWLREIDLGGAFAWHPLTREILESVKILGISYTWPALMAAARRYLHGSQPTFRRVARVVRNFAFRTLTIEGRDVSFLEDHLGLFARSLHRGSDPATLVDTLKTVDPDAEFAAAFSQAAERRVKIQYYILFELERHLNSSSGLQPAPHSPFQHIEHILPQNLSRSPSRLHEWAQFRDPHDATRTTDAHRKLVNRIGNLLILEADINRDVSNYSFPAKQSGAYPSGAGSNRKSYANSQLALAADVANTALYSAWDAAAIEHRQQHLATVAAEIWDLNL